MFEEQVDKIRDTLGKLVIYHYLSTFINVYHSRANWKDRIWSPLSCVPQIYQHDSVLETTVHPKVWVHVIYMFLNTGTINLILSGSLQIKIKTLKYNAWLSKIFGCIFTSWVLVYLIIFLKCQFDDYKGVQTSFLFWSLNKKMYGEM